MEKKPKKKRFEVQEGESISDCLKRIEHEGYTPVRRMEEPVFKEVKKNGKVEIEHCSQKIVFEGRMM
ncbi:NETI motif-containing protein [Anaerobacillus sp. MEB173]|uniref:NETI motif-containing protein n=1 Tax=Anaerobacillus sp. MEB173 TaxID=3383345 RepID=UPI003F8FF5AE